MSRLIPDLTISVREKGQRKSNIIQIFHSDEKKIRVKINGKWFKNKVKFKYENFENIFFKTIENSLHK